MSIAILLLATTLVTADVIDRVLAVVGGQIITLSDVNAALRFGLVPADVSTDPVDAALQRLIDRRLMLAEVERYAPPEPSPASLSRTSLGKSLSRTTPPSQIARAVRITLRNSRTLPGQL